jgi:hypothetical protein
MEHTDPCLDRARLQDTLIAVLDRVLPAYPDIQYRLVGTGAALLHGVDLPAGDVDLTVKERADVDAFCSALSAYECLEPAAWLPHARQYYANYLVNGVEVGISTVEVETESDAIETYGSGPWERHYVLLPCGPYRVPTVRLELRLITELYRDRPERYEPILAHLQAQGCDLGLVRRGLALGPLPQAVQEEVLGRLQGGRGTTDKRR